MAKKHSSGGEENKIPVFTVLKNNAILKNIVVVNQPPPSVEDAAETLDQECDEILLVGRHPHCNIVLEHPSVSRFHLRIHSKPTSQRLSIVDLSSVHGTWVSGKKIEPNVQVELNEGDTMRIGGSSRVYRLHWLSLSRACDLDNPFVPDELIGDEGEEESTGQAKGKEEETLQDAVSLSPEAKRIETLGKVREGVESAFTDDNSGSLVKKLTPIAPPLQDDMKMFQFADEEIAEVVYPVAELFEESDNYFPSENDHELKESLSLLRVPLVTESVEKLFLDAGNQEVDEENQRQQSSFATGVLSDRENFDGSITRSGKEPDVLDNMESSFSEEAMAENDENRSPSRDAHWQREIENKEFENEKGTPDSCQATEGSSERENLESPPMENKQFNKENQTPSLCYAAESSSENVESLPTESETKSNLPSIWSKRGKPASVLQLQTDSIRVKHKQLDEENQIPNLCYAEESSETVESPPVQSEPNSKLPSTRSRKCNPVSALQLQTGSTRGTKSISKALKHDIETKSISKALFHASDGEEEIFTPDKENVTPNTLILRSIKRMGSLEEFKHSHAYKSSPLKATVSPDVNLEKDVFASSEKENQMLEVLQERRSERPQFRTREGVEAERMPFQSLLGNSTGKSKSELSVQSATTRSSNSANCGKTIEAFSNPSCNNFIEEGKRTWNMVVDSTCLLNQESRKSLQLLQGLKGTRLIVPRIVIRELDCLRRRGSLFRRTVDISSALQWIEECMVKTKWWIHVQSSAEEGRSITPTPPASPRSQIGEGSTTSSIPFSIFGSFMEIVSPTAEDHILDYALLSRRIMNEEQLVLLSNDVTLKIKAMAEGLICETAEEFRESLVNPFSERFLWADSSPRGRTWSCLDDVVLKEKYDRCTSKRSSKGPDAAKGLKLILLHNSQYGQHISLGS